MFACCFCCLDLLVMLRLTFYLPAKFAVYLIHCCLLVGFSFFSSHSLFVINVVSVACYTHLPFMSLSLHVYYAFVVCFLPMCLLPSLTYFFFSLPHVCSCPYPSDSFLLVMLISFGGATPLFVTCIGDCGIFSYSLGNIVVKIADNGYQQCLNHSWIVVNRLNQSY